MLAKHYCMVHQDAKGLEKVSHREYECTERENGVILT